MKKDLEEKRHQIYQPLVIHESEISFLDIITLFYRRKNIILIAFVFTVSAALIYTLITERVYEVETILLPPSIENITPLNILSAVDIGKDANKYVLSTDDVFISVSRNIQSRALRKNFFEKFNLLDVLTGDDTSELSEIEKNKIFEGFSKGFNIYEEFKDKKFIRVTLQGENKDKIGYWLDSYILLVNERTINQLYSNLSAEIHSRVQNLKAKIEGKKLIFAQRRADKLLKLEEDYKIAKKLGISQHVLLTNSESTINSDTRKSTKDIKLFQLDRENFPGYMKGTKVLSVEIEFVKIDKSVGYNIVGLRDLQEQLIKYESIKIDKKMLQAMVIDKPAASSIKPIKPKRKLIMLASGVLGLIFGIFVILFLDFLKRMRVEISKTDLN